MKRLQSSGGLSANDVDTLHEEMEHVVGINFVRVYRYRYRYRLRHIDIDFSCSQLCYYAHTHHAALIYFIKQKDISYVASFSDR